MPAICPLAARVDTLQKVVTLILSGNAKLHLLQTSFMTSDGTTLANCVAHEATWPGYSPELLLSWTAATDPAGPIASATAFATFLPSGSSGTVPVFGWFLTDTTSAKFYLVEVFGAVVNITKGAPYTPTVQYNLLSEF